MRDRAQRLAEAPRARPVVRKLVVLAVELDRLLAAQDAPHDLDVLARARERLAERLAVPTLDHLRARHAEPEREAAVRQVIERERVHRARRGRARRDLDDAGAQPDARRVRADPRRGGERVGAPRLGRPHRVVLEPLRFLRQRDRERVRLRAPVAELKSEFHARWSIAPGRLGAWTRLADLRGRRRLRRCHRAGLADVDTVVAAGTGAAGRRAERAAARARRRRVRAARLLRLRHLDARRSTASPRDGVRLTNFHTTALCSPTRVVPAHRAQPPPQRHGPRRRPRGRLPRLLGPHPARERLPLRDPARATATRPTRSASGTSRPTTRRTWPRRAQSWPLARGFDRWYGFHGGETHQFVPSLYHDNHSVLPPRAARGRLPPERRSRRPRDRVPRRPARGRRRPAVLLLLRDRRVPLAAPRAAGMDRALPRAVRRRAGTRGATRRSPARSRTACCPRTPSCRRARTGCPAWDSLKAEDQRGRGAVHGVLRRVPVVHRRADRPACSRSSTGPATSTTRSSSPSPTTARAPRADRRARSTTAGS